MRFKFYWSDWIIKISIFTSVFFLLLSFILVGYTFSVLNIEKTSSSFAVLHSSVYFGVDGIAEAWQIFFLPIFGFAIFLLNLFIADQFWKISHFYTRVILVSLAFIEIFVFLGCVSLWKWNI
jgi:hypothetical protein